MGRVNVVTPSGRTIAVDEAEFGALGQGARRETAGEEAARAHEQVEERRLEGFGGGLRAFGEGAARGLSFGLSDLMLGGDPFEAEDIAARKERNAGLALTGEIGGAIAGAVLVPGSPAFLSARAAAAGGRAVAGAGTSAARRILAMGVEGAIDGGLYGVGQEVSKAALSGDPLTVEKVSAGLALGAATGGAGGVGLGALGEVGRKVLARRAERVTAEAVDAANPLLNARSPEMKEISNRLASEVRGGAVAVEEARTAAMSRRWAEIEEDFATGRRTVTPADVAEYEAKFPRKAPEAETSAADPNKTGAIRKRKVEARVFEGPSADDRVVDLPADSRPPPGVSFGVGKRVDELGTVQDVYHVRAGDLDAHNTKVGAAQYIAHKEARATAEQLVAEYTAAQTALQRTIGRQEFSLNALLRKSPDQVVNIAQRWDEFARAADNLGVHGAEGMVGDMARLGRLTSGMTPQALDAFKRLDTISPETLAEKLGLDPAALKGLRPSSDKILKLYAMAREGEMASARKVVPKPVADAHSILSEGKGILKAAGRLYAAVHHPVATTLLGLVGKYNKQIIEGAARVMSKAPVVRRPATFAATKFLSDLRFSADEEDKKLPVAQRRIKEIDGLVSNPGRLDNFARLATAPISANHLELGTQVADHLKMRLNYYAGHAPRPPIESPLAKSKWQPSPTQVHEWAQRLRAGENPLSLLDDMAGGRMSVAAVETVEELYPELFRAMQTELLDRALELQEAPYHTRLSFSLFFKVPVEATADPEFVDMLQQQYAARRAEQEQSQPRGSVGAPSAPPATKAQQLEAR